MSSLLERLGAALAPQYEVERELASGGMGTVFLARDPKLDRKVAIKILQPDLASETASERFRREARILAKLSHPNIVPVFQAGDADDLSYYVMEYVEGETLKERLARAAMPKDEVLKLADDLLSALEAAHERGIVHRDVKPSNIFLVGDRALIADFGIAKPSDTTAEGLTASGHRIGTPGYMPPEQLLGEEIRPATDIYAAAMVICEALTARQWSIKSSSEEADWSDVPSELVAPLRRALEWEPDDRWQDAAAFRRALQVARRRPVARLAVIGTTATMIALVGIAAGWLLFGGRIDRGAVATSPSAPPTRIAVLYFNDLSEGRELGYLADGFTEALINELSQVQVLQVISRNGVRPYRDTEVTLDSIVRALKVASLVEGSVARSGDRLRVSVQLIDAASGTHIASRTLDRPWGEMLDLLDDVTEEVSRFLRQRIGAEIEVKKRRAGTKSVEAWELVRRAERLEEDFEALFESGDKAAAFLTLQRVDSLLARAEHLDPTWVEPITSRGWLAFFHAFESSGNPRSGEIDTLQFSHAMEPALAHGERAVILKPQDPGALELRGVVRLWLWFYSDSTSLLEGAEQDLRAAIEAEPSRARAWRFLSQLLQSKGELAEANLAARRALEADAFLSGAENIIQRLFSTSLELDREEDAVQWCEEGRRRFPESPGFLGCALVLLATAETVKPNVDSAWGLFDEYVEQLSGALELFPEKEKAMHEMIVAAVLARAGLADSARAVMSRAHAATASDDSSFSATELYVRMLLADALFDSLAEGLKSDPADTAFLMRDFWGRLMLRDPRMRARLDREH